MKNEDLLHYLGKCITACNICADACLDETEHLHMLVQCIRNTTVCAEVCGTVHQVVSTKYGNIEKLLQYCIEVCETCAAECGRHSTMQHCVDCAKACSECAEACRKFAA